MVMMMMFILIKHGELIHVYIFIIRSFTYKLTYSKFSAYASVGKNYH